MRGGIAGLTLLVVAGLVGAATPVGAAVPAEGQPAPAGGSSTDSIGIATDSSSRTPGPPAPDAGAGRESPSAFRTTGDLHQRIDFDLTPDRPGSVTVTVTYDPGADVRAFLMHPAEHATVLEVDGFERDESDNGWRYQWDRTTAAPSITYEVSNSSRANWGLDAVDVGDWALVKPDPPSTAFYSRSREEWTLSYDDPENRITAETNASTDYHYAGRYLFLGEHELRRVSTPEQTVAVVIPEAAGLEVPSSQTLDLVFHAATLDVGGRDETVTMFYAPEPLAQNGLSDGEAAFWVGASRTDSVYIHEYVHTRQNYSPSRAMNWIDEGSADYYEYRLYLETNRSTYDAFHARMNRSVDGVNLTNPETYDSENIGDYVEGRRVLAALDYRIRNATDKRRSLDDVFERMNEEDVLTYDEFVRIVEDVSGEEMEPWLDRYLLTDRSPDVPYDPYMYSADDADVDDDGLTTAAERESGTDPFTADTDGDGLDDGREVDLGTDPTAADTDGDGLADGREVELGTDPTVIDTDTDGMDDAAELSYGTDPTVADVDDDGLEDGREIRLETDPTEADTDGDGLNDGREVDLGTDPTAFDTDEDGLSDGREVDLGTDPTVADTDGDGVEDGQEVDDGTDPTDPESPGTTTVAPTATPTAADGDGGPTTATPNGRDGTTADNGDSGGLPGPGLAGTLIAVLVAAALYRRRGRRLR